MPLNSNLVPLSKVVAAAIVDQYEEKGRVEQMYFHWAAREFKELNRGYLKMGKRYTSLYVNKNTFTATLPPDVKTVTFVGIIENGVKVPLNVNSKYIDNSAISELECDDKCERCGQNKAICEDLQVTEEINLIVINGQTYEQNIIKKLYPNGDYYLETRTPIYNIGAETIIPEVRATATITIEEIGDVSETIEVLVEDPIEGSISLGVYIQTIADINPVIFAQNIAAALASNPYGYSVSSSQGVIQIKAPSGYGATINGGIRATIETIAAGIFDYTFDHTFN